MNYIELKSFVNKESTPTMAKNENDEAVFVTQGHTEFGTHWIQTETAQGGSRRLRVNVYYEDGTTEELYK